jgi:hypothetical protein
MSQPSTFWERLHAAWCVFMWRPSAVIINRQVRPLTAEEAEDVAKAFDGVHEAFEKVSDVFSKIGRQ